MSMMTVLSGAGIQGTMAPRDIVNPPPPPPGHPSGFEPPTLDLANFELMYIEDFGRAFDESPLTNDGTASNFDQLYGLQPNNDWPGGIPATIRSYSSVALDSSKRGRYGSAIASVAPGSSIIRQHIRYENGWPRVSSLAPRLGESIPGQPYGRNDFYGGATEIVWRIDPLPTYKLVPLYWPLSNHSRTADGIGADGEIDFPENGLSTTAKIAGFLHHQGDLNSDSVTEQSVYSGNITAVGPWHKTRVEWIPGIQSPAIAKRSKGGSVRFYHNDVLVKTFLGSVDGIAPPFIPMNPMHWIIQQETNLDKTVPIDLTVSGYFEIDWVAFYLWKGTGF